MPSDERSFMLLLGYSLNQTSMLQKLLMYSSSKTPPTEAEQTLAAAQTQMLLRLLIGAVHETWELIRKRFLAGHIGCDYQDRLDDGGREALAKLKQQFGKSNLISIVRNNFSFHFPDNAAVDAAFLAACDDPGSDELWCLYFSHYGYNSHFLVSDLMVMHGISSLINESNPGDAQERIMEELMSGIVNMFEFTKAFFAAAWLKNFGVALDAKELIKIPVTSPMREISIPFFVDMDS
ncbi:hypothetical protein [Bradyrhizobium genosp. P]|uniref:hypothetical protein n=1 Tax=Bradyrhizobium genosp. P TaxID=83641 RepID=UPI003CE7F825